MVIPFPRPCRFVFANYTWNDDGSPYTVSFNRTIPSQIPYTALIRGTFDRAHFSMYALLMSLQVL